MLPGGTTMFREIYFSPHMWPSPLHVQSGVLNTANTEVFGMMSLGIVRVHRAISSAVLRSDIG